MRKEKPKIQVHMEQKEIERLNQHVQKIYGYIRGARSAWITLAIREKMAREVDK